MIDRIIKDAREIIKNKQIKFIGKSELMGEQYEVKKYIVRIFKKPGRNLWSCSCEQGTKFCNSPSLCKHRIAVLILKLMRTKI